MGYLQRYQHASNKIPINLRIQGAHLWSWLSGETLTVSKRRTVGLNKIIEGIQRGYEMPFWSGGFGGSLEAPLNGG